MFLAFRKWTAFTMADEHDLWIDRASRYAASFTWQYLDGSPVIITDFLARLQIKDEPDGTLLHTFDVGSGLTVNGAIGETLLVVLAATSALWSFDVARYDLLVWNPANLEDDERLVQGNVHLNHNVTSRP